MKYGEAGIAVASMPFTMNVRIGCFEFKSQIPKCLLSVVVLRCSGLLLPVCVVRMHVYVYA